MLNRTTQSLNTTYIPIYFNNDNFRFLYCFFFGSFNLKNKRFAEELCWPIKLGLIVKLIAKYVTLMLNRLCIFKLFYREFI